MLPGFVESMVIIGSGSRGRGGEGAKGSRVGVEYIHVYSIQIYVHASSSFLNIGWFFWRGWGITRVAEMIFGSTGSRHGRRGSEVGYGEGTMNQLDYEETPRLDMAHRTATLTSLL